MAGRATAGKRIARECDPLQSPTRSLGYAERPGCLINQRVMDCRHLGIGSPAHPLALCTRDVFAQCAKADRLGQDEHVQHEHDDRHSIPCWQHRGVKRQDPQRDRQLQESARKAAARDEKHRTDSDMAQGDPCHQPSAVHQLQQLIARPARPLWEREGLDEMIASENDER